MPFRSQGEVYCDRCAPPDPHGVEVTDLGESPRVLWCALCFDLLPTRLTARALLELPETVKTLPPKLAAQVRKMYDV